MRETRHSFPGMVAVILVACATGCSSGPAGQDSGADAIADAIADVAPDAIHDTCADAAADDGRDTVEDTADDATADVGQQDPGGGDAADALEDAKQDVGPEVVLPPLWEDIAPTGVNTVRNTIGVSTHMHQGVGENIERDFEFEKYAELGGGTIREDYHWHRIEPADDAWDLTTVQGQVDQAMANNVKIIPMFGYENGWAQTDGCSSINMEEYGEYVGHVALEYCDRIKDYEIWNEENIPRFWSGEPDPEAYGRMLKAAHTAIKAACPDARVAFGGMASYDAETDLTDRFGFLKRVALAHPDICDYFEIVAFHPYTFMQYDPPERDVIIEKWLVYQGQSAQTEIVRDILSDIGCPEKALMITEQGWPSYDLTEEQVGRFLPRSLLLAARDGVEKYMWYTFWDGYPTTEGIRPHESYFGLFGWTGEDGTVRRAKPAWYSFKAAAVILGDKTFARDISGALGLPNDVYALAFMNDSGEITVACWDGRDFPDQAYLVDGPGGPDTFFLMAMPLPDSLTGVTVSDINGAEIERGTGYTLVDNVVTIVLTPEVTYIQMTQEESIPAGAY